MLRPLPLQSTPATARDVGLATPPAPVALSPVMPRLPRVFTDGFEGPALVGSPSTPAPAEA